jgi:Serine/threonine protein phosphatase
MQLIAHGRTDPGKMRPNNEDAFMLDTAHGLFAVADGLGGLPDGAQASQRIAEDLEAYAQLKLKSKDAPELGDYIQQINAKLFFEGEEKHPFTGWGTTLTLCSIAKSICRIIHVGDSRLYQVRNKYMKKLTIDHTMERQYIRAHGEASRSLMPAEYQHTLTRCLGQNSDIRLDQKYIQLEDEDILLLCSDGLTNYVDEEDIRQTLVNSSSAEKATKTLVDLANEGGGGDNITVVVVYVKA